MPVLFNTTTGKYEEVVESQPGFETPVVSPDGQLGSIAPEQFDDAVRQGFRAPSQDELSARLREQEFQTPAQQALAGAEAAARGATFGLSTGVERALGVDPADIRAREEANPAVAAAGEITGAVGSLFVPGGALNLAGRAGAGTARALGLARGLTAEARLTQRIGAAAVNEAVQGALIQSGVEAHRMFAEDPEQSVSTAISNIGMAAVFGGALGGVGTAGAAGLSAAGKKVSGLLGAVKDRVQAQAGLEAIEREAMQAGVELSPAAKAAMLGDDLVGSTPGTLKQSATAAGDAFRKELDVAEEGLADALVQATGRNMDELAALDELSDFEVGASLKDSLVREIRRVVEPVSKEFDAIQQMFKGVDLPDVERQSLGQKITQLAVDEGHALSPASGTMRSLRRIQKDLPNLKTLEDVRKYQSVVRENLYAQQQYRLSRQVVDLFRDVEERALTEAVGAQAPDMLGRLRSARAGYKDAMNLIDDLNARLKVKKYGGPESFIKNLEDQLDETALRKLSTGKDADLLQLLDSRFAESSAILRKSQLDNLLKKSTDFNTGKINTRTFFRNYDKLSPEMRNYVLKGEQQEALGSVRELLSRLPRNINPSGTARTLDELSRNSLFNMWTFLGGLLADSIPGAVIIGQLGRLLGKEAPDAVRLAVLRSLGRPGPVNSQAVNATSRFAKQLLDGDALVRKAVGGVLRTGVQRVIPDSKVPTEAQLAKLDRNSQKVAASDPVELSGAIAGSMGEYMEGEAAALALTMSRIAMHLEQKRPKPFKGGPLDPEVPPSTFEQLAYGRTLSIAQQPLITLQMVKDGTLTLSDVQDLASMYPELYANLRERLFSQMTQMSSSDERLPHRTLMAMSLFMGDALIGSLKPQNILSNQSLTPSQEQVQPETNPRVVSAAGGKGLEKLASSAMTSSQAAAQRKLGSN